jgi:protein-S-isoprenylcysteine O-methyltransferase Ste14
MIQKLRVPLGFIVAIAVLFLARPNGTTILLGAPLALMGAVLRGLAAGTIKKDYTLATDGPYGWTRNPLYLGSFLLQMGFGLMSGSWIAAALTILPSFIIYPNVIKNEEAHLSRLFPNEFAHYCARVPPFFPRFQTTRHSFSFAQYLQNREYNTALGFAAVLGIFLLKWRLL